MTTAKQIIIDEIDVSGCEAIGTDGWCSLWEENCSKNPDCIHKKYLRKEQECKNWQRELDIAHLLMLEKQDELVKKILQCKELEDDKLLLEIQVAELTSPVNVEDCPHSIFNGEDVYCRYYEGCKCSDLDFANCMFKENVRLKKKIQELKEEVDANKMLP